MREQVSAGVHIVVVLFGTYARHLPPSSHGRVDLRLPRGATVADALDALAVPARERTFLTLDGERVTPDKQVHNGAELRVIVPLGGG